VSKGRRVFKEILASRVKLVWDPKVKQVFKVLLGFKEPQEFRVTQA
jgi:hypothetical protein